MKALSAIFFDVDDTLFSTSEFAQLARRNSIDAMIQHGLKMERHAAFHELQEVIQEFGSNFDNHYQKLLSRLPKEAIADINPAILIAAAVGGYHRTKFESLHPFEEVPAVLALLAKRSGLKLGVITAGLTIKQADKLVRLKVLPFFESSAIFITDQMGIGKLNPKLYHKACEHLGLDPALCMYVGDNPHNDVDPANAIGMITVLLRRGGKYASVEGKTTPSYTIQDFWQLLDILRSDFGISV